jgi:hypothetical protein
MFINKVSSIPFCPASFGYFCFVSFLLVVICFISCKYELRVCNNDILFFFNFYFVYFSL